MTIYTPYFYIIQDTRNGMYYAGAKWAQDTTPENFMKENGYTTSSEIINSIIDEYGLNNFIVRKIRCFMTSKEAYDYETRFLQKVNARNHPKFYNNHNNEGGYKGLIYVLGEGGISKGIPHEEFIKNRNQYKHINESFISAKDVNGNYCRVLKSDPRWKSGELSGVNKGVKCPDKTREAASRKWKGFPKTLEQRQKASESIKKLKWFYNEKTGKIVRFEPGKEPNDFILVSGPHKRLTPEQIDEIKKQHKTNVILRRTSGEQTEARSKAQLNRYLDNPLLGVSEEDLAFIRQVLIEYKRKPEVPKKNSVGRNLSYERSFANVYSEKFCVSHHRVFSVVSGKKNRILKVLSEEPEFQNICKEIIISSS